MKMKGQPTISSKLSPTSITASEGPRLSKSLQFSQTPSTPEREPDLDFFQPLSSENDCFEDDPTDSVVTCRTEDFRKIQLQFQETKPGNIQVDDKEEKTKDPLLVALLNVTRSPRADMGEVEKIVNDAETLGDAIKRAYEHDLITYIFDMMLQHGRSVKCHTIGMRLLRTITRQIPESIPILGEKKGVQLVIHTMLLHKEALELQPLALSTLNRLCTHPRSRELAGAFFCAEAMISAARICASCQYTQMHVLHLMQLLSANDMNRQRLLKVGAARTPLRVLKRHRSNVTLVRHAAELLHTFATGLGLAAVSRLEPAAVVMNAMVQHAEDSRIHTAGIGVICELVRDEAGRRDCTSLRGIDMMSRDLKRFRGSEQRPLHLSCLKAFDRMFKGGMGVAVLHGGGLEAVVMCMTEWRNDMEVMEYGMGMLEDALEMGELSHGKIVTSGVRDMLKAALKTNLNDEAFVTRGVKLLRQLRK